MTTAERRIPWEINVEIRMTPDEAESLRAVLDPEKHSLLIEALGFQVEDFKQHAAMSRWQPAV